MATIPMLSPCPVQYGGKMARGYKIACARCKKTEALHFNTFANRGDDAEHCERIMLRKFEKTGWKIYKDKSLCPDCRALRAKQMRGFHATKAEQEKKMQNGQVKEQPKEQPMPPPSKVSGNMSLANENPRQMTKADRRVIFGALEDHYGGSENDGYQNGWTDQKLATDLGVPVAWVRAVRAENFGDAGSNAEIDKVLSEARTVRAEISAYQGKQQELLELGKKITHLADSIDRRLAAIQKVTGG